MKAPVTTLYKNFLLKQALTTKIGGRAKLAAIHGMTKKEYNYSFLQKAADKLGISVQEYRRNQYNKVVARRGLTINQYQKKLKQEKVKQR